MEQITKHQFSTLSEIYNYYNRELFTDELPQALVCFARHRGAAGIFYPERWTGGSRPVHEIVVNPDCMHISDMEWHQTVVHEMCHLWQQEFGKRSRAGYHNKEWGDKMESIGLMPSSTGKEGGKKRGQRMADYAIAGGLFEIAFNKIDSSSLELILPYMPIPIPTRTRGDNEGEEGKEKEKPKSGVKIKYSCPCGQNVWGKHGLKLACVDCKEIFVEESDDV